jgi:diguanylate cyclase (GGDEF)-like protein
MLRSHRFLVLSAIIGLLVVATMLFLYRQLTISALVDQEERSSVNLAYVLSHSALQNYQAFLTQVESLDIDELRKSAPIQVLDSEIDASIIGTNVHKVLVINTDGLVLYSSNPDQIGKSKLESAGFRSALSGVPSSKFSFRDEFSGAHGVYADLNIVSTYLPMFKRGTQEVIGVFEIYSDVTSLVETLNKSQVQISVAVIGCMLVVYWVLFVVANKADQIQAARQRERVEHEAKLAYQTYYDSLTGLPNRVSFLERLDEAISRAKREKKFISIMFVGIDRFKLVNDSLGHAAGDAVLCEVRNRLQGVIRESDLLFRLAGDGFMVLTESTHSPEGLAHLAQRVLDVVSEPLVINEHNIAVTASAGISLFPRDGGDVEKLLSNADAAKNIAKQSGGNQYQFYTSEMNAEAMKRLAYESALQRALAKNEFVLHYQPRVSNISGEIVGMEALLRWQRETGELVPPFEFIPILEERDLIVEVGAWVLRTALLQVKDWLEQGYPPVRVSVNVSSRQFRNEHFVDSVRDIIKEVGIGADYLELELTESLLVDNTRDAIDVMQRLKDLGIKLSIDDFGTGYSSLSYLKLLPIDFLKIDRSFITDVTSNEKDAAIVSTITTLASELKIGVVAEGIETQGQWELLKTKHCHELQGYFFSKPIQANELVKMLAKPVQAYAG